MVDPLDATDMDMIRRGDMLGTSQGARVAAYIESLAQEREHGRMKLREKVGDETIAEALRIAERRLNSLGWRYADKDVGRVAAEIIAALDDVAPAVREAMK